ncbi:MAG: adenylate/guanylate cyclase domain-containing protein [Bacteroidetes bacterium]|nr:adenylate/guanylate cyclase domain-containing protein [Bacteroidota bacterium]MCW5895694.1 adenylate/guanylate cyclase domain-containing protein [Bacteroidota bacterium]
MHMSSPFRLQSWREHQIRSIVNTSLVMFCVGITYVLVFAEFHWHSLFNGVVIGLILGWGTSVAEMFVFSRYRQRLSFSVMITLRTLFYVMLISVTVFYVILIHAAWMHDTSTAAAFYDPKFQDFLWNGEFLRVIVYALAASFLINFIRQVNRLLGHNALLMFVTGKYHQPIEEERIFMFLDIKSSTAIAERLGNVRYHKFLNDFFHDISPAIVESKGTIYQYVGDEVVVTWTGEKGLKDANCIACYFRVAAAIFMNAEKYEKTYGFVPEFKAGYHYGPVITGEIGDVKREIVYHGDTVNTAARIRTECTTLQKDLLLSADLMQRLPRTEYLSPQSIGRIRLRGKEEEVELYSILEAA